MNGRFCCRCGGDGGAKEEMAEVRLDRHRAPPHATATAVSRRSVGALHNRSAAYAYAYADDVAELLSLSSKRAGRMTLGSISTTTYTRPKASIMR